MAVEQTETVVVSPEVGLLAPGQQPDGSIPTKPEGLPDEFWDATKGEVKINDFAKSYADLKAAQKPAEGAPADTGAAAEADDTAAKKDGEGEPKPEEKPSEVQDFLGKAGLDMAELGTAFQKDGKLPDEAYAKLAELGITKEFADQVSRGQIALAEAATRQINDAAGGADRATELLQWASTNLPADKIEELNKSFDSADVNAAVLAMGTLKGLYEDKNGRPPAVRVQGAPSVAQVGFASWAEVTAAMSDPKYKADPAYRAQVEQKLRNSRI